MSNTTKKEKLETKLTEIAVVKGGATGLNFPMSQAERTAADVASSDGKSPLHEQATSPEG